MVDWLTESEWNLKLFESWTRGNKRTFPKLSSLHYDLHEFKFISSQNPRVRIIWLLSFKKNEKGFEKSSIPFGHISNSEDLCKSMIFMREDKMTSSNYVK